LDDEEEEAPSSLMASEDRDQRLNGFLQQKQQTSKAAAT
jgi:hypothetical protein